jgi:hypothetical protein
MLAEGTFSDIQAIYDWWDNSQLSLVDYEGFEAPVSLAPKSWGSIKAGYR